MQFFIVNFPKKSSRFYLNFLVDFSIEKRWDNHKSIVVEFVGFYFLCHCIDDSSVSVDRWGYMCKKGGGMEFD